MWTSEASRGGVVGGQLVETNHLEHAAAHQEGESVQVRQASSHGEVDRVEEEIDGRPSFQCYTSAFSLYPSDYQLILKYLKGFSMK